MLYIWNIEKIITHTLQEHKLAINFQSNNDLPAPMSYNVSTNTIAFNYLQINGYMSKVKIRESKEDFVRIILYHEIGYYLTFQKHRHDLRTLMYGEDAEIAELKEIIETNAWEYGRKLVPEHLLHAYDRVREENQQLIKGL
ncbi:hypothetical protein [Halobacillus litoralis]|uniref:hypothetical protein n=1 Tax=Halobacillus litoralis TaxID=45668 RepID=UPI001CFC8786|nr:hypothetical protein [Halobacillus litoralis]